LPEIEDEVEYDVMKNHLSCRIHLVLVMVIIWG